MNFIFYQKDKKILSPFTLAKLVGEKDPDFNIFRADVSVMRDFFALRPSSLSAVDCVVYDANKHKYTPVELPDFTESDLYLLKSLWKNDRLKMDALDLTEIEKSKTRKEKKTKGGSKNSSGKKSKRRSEDYYDSMDNVYDTYNSDDEEFGDYDL